ncbi:hypothetical protein SEA_SOOS_66 [Gordonia phage Soos]|nr:hypothetical protein SEA_SOOS_66 [Gordonia phage Soos]
MSLVYRGPDATAADHLITLGQGDGRWAKATDLSALDSSLQAVKADRFADSSRSTAPMCEVFLTTQYTNGANADAFAGAGWTVNSETPQMFYGVGQGSGIGNTTYSRMRLPFSGMWTLDFQLVYGGSTSFNGACKIMAKTGTAAPSVLNDSVASDFSPSAVSVEGCPLHAVVTRYFAANTIVYWSTWRSTSGTVLVTNFGNIRTKIAAYWEGP